MERIFKMKYKYKVSAIVSVYKGEKFIKGLLENLTSQTLFKKREMQIIIINANSPENECEIVNEFHIQENTIPKPASIVRYNPLPT